MRRWIIGLIIVAVLGVGGYFVYQQTQGDPNTTADAPNNPDSVNSITVDTGLDNVAAEGRIVPLDSTNLAFLISGQVAEILVEEGDTVAQGDVLIQLDATDQEIAVQQANAALTQAQANLQTAEASLAQAQVGLDGAELAVTAAQVQRDLLTAEPTEEQLALQESQVAVAQASVTQASGSRAAALEGAQAGEIRAAEAAVQAAEAATVAPRNRLDQLQRDGANDDQIRQAQLAYNAAIANLNAAQARLNDVLAGATTGEQQAANSAVGAAVAQQEAAEANLALFLAGAQEEQIRISEIAIERAQQEVTTAELAIQQAEVQLTNAQNSVAEAEAALATAESALSRTRLIAPRDGQIASQTAKIGQVINPGIPIIIMGDFSGWQVETTDLTELNIVSIATGYAVEIEIDAFPDETIRGTITDIASVSDVVLGDVTYRVTIDLEDTALPLRWGMTTFVNIDTAQ